MKLDENILRQGDVLLVYRGKTDTNPLVVQLGQAVVLAFGETTGHRHQLRRKTSGITSPDIPVFDASAERYIQLLDQGELSHEEHSIVLLRPGTIEVGVQVEAGPHNMLRRVQD